MYKAMGGVKSGNGNEKGIVKMPNEIVLVKISIQINYFKMYIMRVHQTIFVRQFDTYYRLL